MRSVPGISGLMIACAALLGFTAPSRAAEPAPPINVHAAAVHTAARATHRHHFARRHPSHATPGSLVCTPLAARRPAGPPAAPAPHPTRHRATLPVIARSIPNPRGSKAGTMQAFVTHETGVVVSITTHRLVPRQNRVPLPGADPVRSARGPPRGSPTDLRDPTVPPQLPSTRRSLRPDSPKSSRPFHLTPLTVRSPGPSHGSPSARSARPSIPPRFRNSRLASGHLRVRPTEGEAARSFLPSMGGSPCFASSPSRC